jgi:phospholipid/cholesterol/gamma-HCH transport system substrate-binding protein
MNKTNDILDSEATAKNRTDEPFKIRRVNQITGVFVLIVVSVLVAVVLWMGHSQRWFRSRVTLKITLPEAGAAGIRQGSEVYFLGTLVGSVSDVTVYPTGRMEAEANIRRDFFRFVRADSSAVVKKKFGVAGDSFFELTRGNGQSLPEADASIVCNEQFQSPLEAAVEEIRGETLNVLKKTSAGLETWAKLGADLRETRVHLDQATIRLDNIAADVEAGKGTIGKLITDTTLLDEAHELLGKANQTVSQLQGAVTNVNLAAADLPGITGAVSDEAKELPGLVQQTHTSMRELERLIEALQRNWLVRKYVNKTNPAPMVPKYGSEPFPKSQKTANEPRILRR